MNSEEVIKLENVLEVLNRKISNLQRTKQILDNIKRCLDEVYKYVSNLLLNRFV